MKIFLTGGAGFIGSHIAERLAKEHEVITYDNFSTGHIENCKAGVVIKGDILDKKELFSSCPEGVDVIIHQAASLEIFKSIDDPVLDLRTNAIGTLNVLELARVKGVKKFINASSGCVYGQADISPTSEDHRKKPNWAYGISKLAGEHYVRLYQDMFGIQGVSLRYGIVYGPREWYGRVLTMFLSRVLEGKSPVVFEPGRAERDFVSVRDVAELHARLLDNDLVWGRVLNVGTGRGTSVSSLARLVCTACSDGKLQPIYEQVNEGEFSAEMPTRKRIPQELRQMILHPGKMEDLTGMMFDQNLMGGIKEEFEWIKANPHRWDTKGMVRV